MTIRTLSAKYGIPVDKALEILEKNGIICFGENISFSSDAKANKAEKIIADATNAFRSETKTKTNNR